MFGAESTHEFCSAVPPYKLSLFEPVFYPEGEPIEPIPINLSSLSGALAFCELIGVVFLGISTS